MSKLRRVAILVALVATVSGAPARAADPIEFRYVASGAGGAVVVVVADVDTPAGRVAPGDFRFTVQGTSSSFMVDDAARLPGEMVGISVSTQSGIGARLCARDGEMYTLTDLTPGERVSVSVANYETVCFPTGYLGGTAGTITVWP